MQYLETMFSSVECEARLSKESEWNARIRAYGREKKKRISDKPWKTFTMHLPLGRALVPTVIML
jgi:hypothetical protein